MNNTEFRSGAINASECLNEAWNLVKPNYGIFVAMTFVFFVVTILTSMIPYIGGILNVVVAGTLLCGIYFALLNQSRGTNATFSMMFGTVDRVAPIVLVQLAQMLPFLVLPVLLYLLATYTTTFDIPDDFSKFNLMLPYISLMLLIYLITLVTALFMFFALPLIADRNVGFLEAVRLSSSAAMNNIGGIIVLWLLEVAVSFAGLIALCIGIFFVLPIIYAMNIAAYRRVFPDDQPTYNNEPPRPDAYGETYGTPI